jgi:hypothetical protein
MQQTHHNHDIQQTLCSSRITITAYSSRYAAHASHSPSREVYKSCAAAVTAQAINALQQLEAAIHCTT